MIPARPMRAFQTLILVLRGSGRGCPLLRALNEHILIVRVLRARRAPGRSFLILLLQSAEEGVTREALKREAARFLCPDWLASDGTNDLNRRITLDPSNWRDFPFSLLAHNPLDLNDRAPMPAIDSRILRRG